MSPNPYTISSRIGFHYFPDTLHYRAADLHAWLPVLQGLGAGWLVVRSEAARAIPENFLCELVQAGIEPVIQFDLSLEAAPQANQLGTLFAMYARWGARYAILFDQPNIRSAWSRSEWAQQDLVERFLDRFLPAALPAVAMGLKPVFSPLAPGGSYWDTAFLGAALEALDRRKCATVIENLVLSAYAWTGGHPLDWGEGGPQRWAGARPYYTPENSQDQRGFRIFEWYLAAARSLFGRDLPVILLQAGLPGAPEALPPAAAREESYADNCLEIARMLDGASESTDLLPRQVLAANYWLLSAAKGSPEARHAWFPEDGPPHPLAARLQAFRRQTAEQRKSAQEPVCAPRQAAQKPIDHYLLLPGGEWGVSDWYLELVRPFVKKYRPTLGFSPTEAERAARVTVIGSAKQYPAGMLERLQNSGCKIEQITGTGTEIASTLAER